MNTVMSKFVKTVRNSVNYFSGVLAQARADADRTHANNPAIPNPFVLASSSQTHPGTSGPNAGAVPNDQLGNCGTVVISELLPKCTRKDEKSGR
uniref:Uncharacterized protein n=1 Tax=Ditylenchus dipsaci TaxID=166011 RepID=A0A915CQJ1_9BILA